MVYLILLIPIAIIVFMIFSCTWKISLRVQSRHPSLLVDYKKDTFPLSTKAYLDRGMIYLDKNNGLLRNLSELASDSATISELNDEEIDKIIKRKSYFKRLLGGYLALAFICLVLYSTVIQLCCK